ncbi:MAG: pseudouridine-5'-phosphate glycosidase [Clostridiales bacterium]|nr:pseudouridine-5'-phosphate glycosidase [Clostridiales bacterium]
MDEDTGCVLDENLKTGVLEEFNLEKDEMDDILDEILESASEG